MKPVEQDHFLHSFEFAQKTKPFEAIAALHNALIPFSTEFSLSSPKKMLLSSERKNAFILLISDGCLSISHAKEDLLISTAFSPTVIGLIDGYSLFYDVEARPQHYIQAETDCTGWAIPLDVFVEKCDELNLWHNVSKILAQRLMIMSAREKELVGNDAYSKIRALLIELWLYPEEIKNKLNVSLFIQRRTKMSRSGIMNVLAELKKGGYIEVEFGVLKSVKKLPKSY